MGRSASGYNNVFYVVYLAGLSFTGLYMNPLNASNQTIGCHGNTILEHLLVYWIGPFATVVSTTILLSRLKAKFSREEKRA